MFPCHRRPSVFIHRTLVKGTGYRFSALLSYVRQEYKYRA